VKKRKLYTDLTQDLYNFEARATPGRKHDFARHIDLERLELFLARIAFQLCALNVLHNLLYTQPASKIQVKDGAGVRGYTHALPITPHASFATAPFSFNFDQNPGLC
jgi:hypothetical protein